MQWALGIDLGGTNCKAAAIASDGSRHAADDSRPTRAERGPDAVIALMAEMARDAMAALRHIDPDAECVGVGVGAPGPLNIADGVVLSAPNLKWTNLPLRQRMSDALKLPVAIENDANCAVSGECWIGAGRRHRYVIGLTLGTGIGGGIVIDGRLYHGASDGAGEFGHMVIDLNGPLCACGNHGCLEALASGTNIARRARELYSAHGEAPAEVTAETVYRSAAASDPIATRVVNDTSRYLGIGVANLLNLFNPDRVLMLGGVARAGDALLVPLRREVAARAFAGAVRATDIVPGQLGNLAGVYGAARALFDQRAAGTI